jgi:hypothetical protein
MDKLQLHTSLCERFPEWSEQIRQLAQQDPDFDEACSDYEELKRWLAAHNHEACPPESTCALNRLLLADLEVEILQSLRATDRRPGRQD